MALRQSETYLTEAQRLSHTSSFGWNVSSGEIRWSEESYRIFEYDPATRPTIEIVLNRVHPDDVALGRSPESFLSESFWSVVLQQSVGDGCEKVPPRPALVLRVAQ
jgi:hypothetical protein